ncbi:MAG: IS607 family transposase [Gammaproteobacteria bacterium]
MIKLLSISEASEYLGVTPATLRRWERSGRLKPAERTIGKQRRYDISQLKPHLFRNVPLIQNKTTYAYARVSSHDQKSDLQRQIEMLELYCASQGWQYEIISDLGSGMNYHKRGLRKLLNDIVEGNVGRLVLTHKDRLLRFGSELVFALCEAKSVEVVLINQSTELSFEEELAQDVLEIVTVFSARLYGARKGKNQRLMQNLKEAVESV